MIEPRSPKKRRQVVFDVIVPCEFLGIADIHPQFKEQSSISREFANLGTDVIEVTSQTYLTGMFLVFPAGEKRFDAVDSTKCFAGAIDLGEEIHGCRTFRITRPGVNAAERSEPTRPIPARVHPVGMPGMPPDLWGASPLYENETL